MHIYVFDRAKGGLNQAKVEAIIVEAGHDADDFAYSVISNDSVSATGDVVMNCNDLENAAKQLGVKGVSVSSNAGDGADAPVAAATRSIAHTPLAATQYGITINMSAATVTALSQGNYSLYGFKAVQSSVGGGKPLVWFQSDKFGLNTQVSWQIQYQAYTSQSAIIPGGEIDGLSSYDADLGQKLTITTPQGTGSVGQGDTARGIEILNGTTSPVTCGISEVVQGQAKPLCAFPLYGKGLDAMVPIQKVMLSFATKQVNTGTVIEKAYSESLLIDLTSASQRTVNFDINTGWSWGGYAWGQPIPANSDVTPILIEDSTTLEAGAMTLLD